MEHPSQIEDHLLSSPVMCKVRKTDILPSRINTSRLLISAYFVKEASEKRNSVNVPQIQKKATESKMSEFFKRRLERSGACQKCPTRSPVGELERKTIDNDLARRVDSVDPEQGPSSAHCSRQTRWVNYRASSESIDARIESRGTSSNRVDEDECRRARKSRSSRRHRRRQRRSRSLTNHKGNYRRSRSSSLSVEEMELSRQRCNRSNSSNESSRRLSVNDEEQMLQEHYEYQYGCYYEGAYQYDCPWEEFEGDRGYHSC